MNSAKALSNLKIEALNAMQQKFIQEYPEHNELCLISPTGSGKTIAYLLPALDQLQKDLKEVQVLVIVPSRELALQIEKVFKAMSTGFKVSCCYGGHLVKTEVNNLIEPPAILIGTPGRIAHHIDQKNFATNSVATIILDEFDKSLESGFDEEMKFIMQNTRRVKKKVFVSATALTPLPTFTNAKEPFIVDFSSEAKSTNQNLTELFVRTGDRPKPKALLHLLSKANLGTVVIFCNQRDQIKEVSQQLSDFKVVHGIYHGQMEQMEREKMLIKLRNGSVPILVTTDLAARGLDIAEIKTVIHFQLPTSEDVMIHRNGRTARMNAFGTVYYLLGSAEFLPAFVKKDLEQDELPEKLNLPNAPKWQTIYISAGKKDKISKMDIVGMLLQRGKLIKDDLGKIEVLDFSSYAAIRSGKILKTLELIKNEKIKNKKVKIEIAN